MLPATLDQAGEVGRCCICGGPHYTCLCQRCYEQHAPDGNKPAWLLALQREAKRITERDRRSRRRGNNRGLGVSFVGLGADW